MIYTFRSQRGTLVILKNGQIEEKKIVSIIMTALNDLLRQSSSIIECIWNKCGDPTYKLTENDTEFLQEIGLVDAHGAIVKSVRNIFISALRIRPSGIYLGDPIKHNFVKLGSMLERCVCDKVMSYFLHCLICQFFTVSCVKK